ADHQSVELLPHLEALGALLVAIAAEIGALGEAGHTVIADLDVEPGVLDGADRDGQHVALLDPAGRARCARSAGSSASPSAAALKLLHAERNPLLLDIDIEHLRLHRLALAMERKRLLARNAPRDVGHVNHAV